MWDSLPGTALFSIQSSCFLCIPGFANTSQMRLLPQDHWLVHLEAGFNHRNHFLTGELLNTFQDSVPEKLMWIPQPTLHSSPSCSNLSGQPSHCTRQRLVCDALVVLHYSESVKALCCFMVSKILSQTSLYFESHAID